MDYFNDAYRPFEVTHLSNSFNLRILNSIRDYMPSGARNESCCLRTEPGKLEEVYMNSKTNKKLPPNPSVYGLPSGSSNTSSELSLIDSDDEPNGSEEGSNFDDLSTHPTATNTSSFMAPLTSRLSIDTARAELATRFHVSAYPLVRYLGELEVYPPEQQLPSGTAQTDDKCEPCEPNMSKLDLQLYKNYVNIGRSSDWRLITDVMCVHPGDRESQANELKLEYAACFGWIPSRSDESVRREYRNVFKSMMSPAPSEADFKLYCNHVACRSIEVVK